MVVGYDIPIADSINLDQFLPVRRVSQLPTIKVFGIGMRDCFIGYDFGVNDDMNCIFCFDKRV
jgi:hypothetical protein